MSHRDQAAGNLNNCCHKRTGNQQTGPNGPGPSLSVTKCTQPRHGPLRESEPAENTTGTGSTSEEEATLRSVAWVNIRLSCWHLLTLAVAENESVQSVKARIAHKVGRAADAFHLLDRKGIMADDLKIGACQLSDAEAIVVMRFHPDAHVPDAERFDTWGSLPFLAIPQLSMARLPCGALAVSARLERNTVTSDWELDVSNSQAETRWLLHFLIPEGADSIVLLNPRFATSVMCPLCKGLLYVEPTVQSLRIANWSLRSLHDNQRPLYRRHHRTDAALAYLHHNSAPCDTPLFLESHPY